MASRRSTKRAADPGQLARLDGPQQPQQGKEVHLGDGQEDAKAGDAHPAPRIDDRPWRPRGASREWIEDQRGWDERTRRALSMTEAEKLDQLLSSLGFCPACNRVVVVHRINTLTTIADPLPRDRKAIADHLGGRFTGFSQRTPMMSGQPPAKVREAHECNAPLAEPHPVRGWKPGDGYRADIYDGG